MEQNAANVKPPPATMSRSLLRSAVDIVEPAVGRPLERVTASTEFAVTIGAARRWRRSVGHRVDAAASWALHQAGLPSYADMRRMQRQLATVERQLSAVRRELDEQGIHADRGP
jgi:hypothetical protein